MLASTIDCLILIWLVATWFYEGHHKKCKVQLLCASCGATSEQDCGAN